MAPCPPVWVSAASLVARNRSGLFILCHATPRPLTPDCRGAGHPDGRDRTLHAPGVGAGPVAAGDVGECLYSHGANNGFIVRAVGGGARGPAVDGRASWDHAGSACRGRLLDARVPGRTGPMDLADRTALGSLGVRDRDRVWADANRPDGSAHRRCIHLEHSGLRGVAGRCHGRSLDALCGQPGGHGRPHGRQPGDPGLRRRHAARLCAGHGAHGLADGRGFLPAQCRLARRPTRRRAFPRVGDGRPAGCRGPADVAHILASTVCLAGRHGCRGGPGGILLPAPATHGDSPECRETAGGDRQSEGGADRAVAMGAHERFPRAGGHAQSGGVDRDSGASPDQIGGGANRIGGLSGEPAAIL